MQTDTQEQIGRKDPIADLIGGGEEAGQDAGRQPGRTRPTPEEIRSQIAQSEMVLAIRKDDGRAYEAHAISDGIAYRPWFDEDDESYKWSLTLDFLRDHQILRFVDHAALAQALAVLATENANQRSRLSKYAEFIGQTYSSLGKNGRRKMQQHAGTGLGRLLKTLRS
jgi:hypothetical protein